MKSKILLLILCCFLLSGCATIYDKFGIKDKAEAHQLAVQMARNSIKSLIKFKIASMDIDASVKTYLLTVADGIVDRIFEKMNDVYKKYTREEMENDSADKVLAELDNQALQMNLKIHFSQK